MVKIREGLQLLVGGWRADNHTVELFAARKVVVVQATAKRFHAGSTPVAESGCARDQGVPTDIFKEVGRLARDRAALCGVLLSSAPRTDSKRLVTAKWTGVKKL